MGWIGSITQAEGLTASEANELNALMDVYRATRQRNSEIEAYYEGTVAPRDIGVDTLLQQVKLNVNISCDWPKKAVDSLANLIRFDGFVFDDERDESLSEILRDCGFDAAFSRHRIGMLKNGCMFVTVGKEGTRPYVRFHSANTGAAIMNAATERIRSGFVISDMGLTEWSPRKAVPTQVNLYGEGWQVSIRSTGPSSWSAEHVEVPDGICMMVPVAYKPTDTKPLGSTRITRQVRDLVDDVLHLRQTLVLSTELYAAPMRYIVGLTDATFKSLKDNPKWALYLNPVFAATRDSKGNVPEVGQLPANSPAALLDLIYADARMFSGATGVPLNSLGVEQQGTVSADAIAERRRDLTDEAQALIDGQLKPAMRQVALLVMMVEHNASSVEELNEIQRSVMPHFRSPAMPSIAASTDAAMKVSSVNDSFAQTRSFFEMIGFDEAAITRVLNEMRMAKMRANMTPLLAQTRGERDQAITTVELGSAQSVAQEAPEASDVTE